MHITRHKLSARRMRLGVLLFVVASSVLLPRLAIAQGLTGALIGTVKDDQGGVLPGALVRVSSPALIGGLATLTTNEKGQLRFPALSPGPYALDIELPGFATFHEDDIRIGAGATIERTVVLKLAGVAESIVIQGWAHGSRLAPLDSARASAQRISKRSRRGGRACLTRFASNCGRRSSAAREEESE